MKTKGFRHFWTRQRAAFVATGPLLVPAFVLDLAYWAAHLAGWRADMSLLSGTEAGGYGSFSAVHCAIYLLLYFAWTVVSPILVLAAGLLWISGMTRSRER